MTPEEHRENKTFTISQADFPFFSLAASLGFKKLTYNAHGIDREHAARIGQALSRKHLDYFAIEFASVESSGWRALANAAEGTTVRELCIVHKSTGGDETRETCEELAYLCTNINAQMFRLMSSKFEEGSVNAFAECLAELDNTTLQEVDIRDISKPHPSDQITHSQLDEFVLSNRE